MCLLCAEVFRNALQLAGSMLIVLDKWKGSAYKTRIWTIFENHVAAEMGIEPRMVLPAAEEASLIITLESDRRQVVDEFGNVDVEKAEAREPADMYSIKLEIVKSCVGFDELNKRFSTCLVNCATRLFGATLLAETLNGDPTPQLQLQIASKETAAAEGESTRVEAEDLSMKGRTRG